MKTRLGFVSNSSSSSFLVVFDKVPTNVNEMQQSLFGDETVFPNPYYDAKYSPVRGWQASEVAKTVWGDLEGHNPLNEDQIIEEISTGYFEGYPEMDLDLRLSSSDREAWNVYWKKRNEEVKKAATELYNARLKGKENVYVFHYSDNDGAYGSALEHGGLFDKLLHIRISHH